MSFGLGDITAEAQGRVAAGDLTGARDLLDEALTTADPRPAHASPELADAAGLQARVLVALADPQGARAWAAFAYSAATRLYGPQDERTVAATATLAAVLHRVGSHARAAHLYRDVITELSAIDGPESLRVLAAHADLATVEYARGQCEIARNRLEDAWELHREVYGDAHPAGIKMLARLGAMQRDCGRSTEADGHLALARELCREHLPADHPLALQVAGLADAGADPQHVCDAGPPPAEAGPATAGPRAIGPEPTPPESHLYSTDISQAYGSAPQQPPEPPPPDPRPDPPPDEPWWPPEPPERDEERSDAAPESTAAKPLAPGFPATARAAAGAPPPLGGGPDARPTAQLPPDFDDLPRRQTQPLVVATLVGIVLIAVTVIVSLALTGGDPPPRATTPTAPPASPSPGPTAPSPSTSATPPRTSAAPSPAPAGAAPTGVTLRDNRDNVALAWTYPPGAEGPVLVSGGRSGQQPRAFQELPAGTSSYVVYGLNERTDYCFTVAVVYSTDTVGRAAPVCTTRTAAAAR